MKVLHLISGGDTGGARTHVTTLLKEMQKHIDVKLVCFLREEAFYSVAVEHGIDVEIMEQRSRYDLSVLKRLLDLIKQEKYDILHTHGARANFITVALKRHIQIPTVTTVHSDYRLDFDKPLYRKVVYTGLNMLALRFIDYYIAVSQSFKNMLLERGYPEHRVFKVYNGMDFNQEIQFCSKEQFLKEKNVSFTEQDLFVGIIGRLDKVKGHEVFIRAAAEVAAKEPHVKFLLAGDGEEKENLQRLAKQLHIEDKVIFLGFIPRVYDFINTIDINTLTSYSESFPYALLEGARMRKATISSAVGGIPDLIKDGENGYLFTSADPIELADKLLQLIRSEKQRVEFGERLYEYAKNHFSSESLSNAHIEIYKEILKKSMGEGK